MVYVCSDLHGYRLGGFLRLLEKAGFSMNDELFILGDVIDRNGDGGVDMLQWIRRQPNFRMIMGNHESMLINCLEYFEHPEMTDPLPYNMRLYFHNGGGVTWRSLENLRQRNRSEFDSLTEFVKNLPLAYQIDCNGRKFVLVHGGLGAFRKDRDLGEYEPEEILWERPEPDTVYYDDRTVIFGHTPTLYYGDRYRGRMLFTESWIDIDCGCAGGLDPGVLRLDDMTEFYCFS